MADVERDPLAERARIERAYPVPVQCDSCDGVFPVDAMLLNMVSRQTYRCRPCALGSEGVAEVY